MSLGVELPTLTRCPDTSPSRGQRKKRPLVFKPEGPIGPSFQCELRVRLGKDYPSETWVAFGILQ